MIGPWLRCAGGVLELEAEQRVLGLDGLVVDGDALPFDILADDGEHGPLLAGQGHRLVDGVLEEVAELRRGRRVAHRRGRKTVAELRRGFAGMSGIRIVGDHRSRRPITQTESIEFLRGSGSAQCLGFHATVAVTHRAPLRT